MSTEPAPETGSDPESDSGPEARSGIRSESNPTGADGAQQALRQTLRQRGIEQRLTLSESQCAAWSTTICEAIEGHFSQLAARRVGFCWPIRSEPDLRPLMRAWSVRGEPGFAALLPVVVGKGMPLAFRRWIEDQDRPLVPDRYGIPTPDAGEFETPEALLIPVNAFDANGYRIGYGGGFFDRTIAALPSEIITIGVGFELARVASTYPQEHDVRLDTIITERGVFPTQRAAG